MVEDSSILLFVKTRPVTSTLHVVGQEQQRSKKIKIGTDQWMYSAAHGKRYSFLDPHNSAISYLILDFFICII